MTKIKDLEVGQTCEGFYAVYSAEERDFRDTSKGKYLKLEVSDSTGRVNCNWWDWQKTGFSLNSFKLGQIVKIRGTVDEYAGQKQILVSRLRWADKEEYQISDFLPVSPQPESEVRKRIGSLVDELKCDYIRQLVDRLIADEADMNAYLFAPAAERHHHAYIRGLAEHSCNVAEVALSLADHYPELDRDLLIFGGLFHDYGKIHSYSVTTTIQYSLAGRLVDHISLADAEITARANTIEAFPIETLLKIRHLILSHHGDRMYGSPVEPVTAEAYILNFADMIDSRMEMVRSGRDSTDAGGWSYVKSLRRNIFYGLPLSGNDEDKGE